MSGTPERAHEMKRAMLAPPTETRTVVSMIVTNTDEGVCGALVISAGRSRCFGRDPFVGCRQKS
jgi:hypothetical protein